MLATGYAAAGKGAVAPTIPPSGVYSCASRQPPAARRILPQCRSTKRTDEKPSAEALQNLGGLPPAPPPTAADVPPPVQPAASKGEEEGFLWFDRPASKQDAPLRKRGMQAGASGEYLDSERFTRDMMQISVGQRTSASDGGALSLPEAPRPWAARALAAASLAAGLVALLVPDAVPPLLMDSVDVAAGERWQLLTASLEPDSVLSMVATLAALGTAGVYAERRLGTTLFTAAYLLGGTTSTVIHYAVSVLVGVGLTTWGATPALLAPAAMLATFAAGNWRVLGQAAQQGQCVAAAAGLAAVALTDGGDPLTNATAVAGGLLLGWLAGPKLEILRELDIAEGSMTIQGDEAELLVVVDRRTTPRRLLVCAVLALPLLGLLRGADWLLQEELQLVGLQLWLADHFNDPEVQQLLYELGGSDAWDLTA